MKHREVAVNVDTRWGINEENKITIAVQGQQDRVMLFSLFFNIFFAKKT